MRSPRVLLRLVGGDPQAWDLLALPFVLSHHGYLPSSRSAMWYARGLPLWRLLASSFFTTSLCEPAVQGTAEGSLARRSIETFGPIELRNLGWVAYDQLHMDVIYHSLTRWSRFRHYDRMSQCCDRIYHFCVKRVFKGRLTQVPLGDHVSLNLGAYPSSVLACATRGQIRAFNSNILRRNPRLWPWVLTRRDDSLHPERHEIHSLNHDKVYIK